MFSPFYKLLILFELLKLLKFCHVVIGYGNIGDSFILDWLGLQEGKVYG